jgi:hypothetical protein
MQLKCKKASRILQVWAQKAAVMQALRRKESMASTHYQLFLLRKCFLRGLWFTVIRKRKYRQQITQAILFQSVFIKLQAWRQWRIVFHGKRIQHHKHYVALNHWSTRLYRQCWDIWMKFIQHNRKKKQLMHERILEAIDMRRDRFMKLGFCALVEASLDFRSHRVTALQKSISSSLQRIWNITWRVAQKWRRFAAQQRARKSNQFSNNQSLPSSELIQNGPSLPVPTLNGILGSRQKHVQDLLKVWASTAGAAHRTISMANRSATHALMAELEILTATKQRMRPRLSLAFDEVQGSFRTQSSSKYLCSNNEQSVNATIEHHMRPITSHSVLDFQAPASSFANNFHAMGRLSSFSGLNSNGTTSDYQLPQMLQQDMQQKALPTEEYNIPPESFCTPNNDLIQHNCFQPNTSNFTLAITTNKLELQKKNSCSSFVSESLPPLEQPQQDIINDTDDRKIQGVCKSIDSHTSDGVEHANPNKDKLDSKISHIMAESIRDQLICESLNMVPVPMQSLVQQGANIPKSLDSSFISVASNPPAPPPVPPTPPTPVQYSSNCSFSPSIHLADELAQLEHELQMFQKLQSDQVQYKKELYQLQRVLEIQRASNESTIEYYDVDSVQRRISWLQLQRKEYQIHKDNYRKQMKYLSERLQCMLTGQFGPS